MFFKTNEEWQKYGVTTDMEKLLAMRLLELFDERTFDSWQVRYSCPCLILHEILDALGTLQKTPVAHHNIKHLLDEAREMFSSDPLMHIHYPLALDFLSNISYENIKSSNPDAVTVATKQVEIILSILDDYSKKLCDELCDLLALNDAKEKRRLLKLTDSLATHLTTCGYSTPFLKQLFDAEIMQESSIPLHKRIFAVLSGLSYDFHEYTCYCLVRWPTTLLNIDSSGFVKVTVDQAHPHEINIKAFSKLDKDASVVRLKVKAMDPFAARHIAAINLGQIHAMFRLYAPSKKTIREHERILVIDANGDATGVDQDESRLRYVQDAKRPETGVTKLLAIKDRNFPAVLNSLQYHRMHADAGTDEARLINLWIALETVVPRLDGSVIGSLSEYVPYSIATSYVHNVCRALAASCKYLWINRDSDCPLNAFMPRSKEFFMNLDDLLKVMTDVDNGERILAFLKFAGDHPLLVNRINTLWETMFKDPKTLAERLERHRQHVDWQLRRIYRTRNYILHNGMVVPGVRHLIQHLHTYYASFMHNLIRDLEFSKIGSAEEASIYRKGKYESLIKQLRAPKVCKLSARAVLLLDFSGHASADELIWTPGSALATQKNRKVEHDEGVQASGEPTAGGLNGG